MTELVLEDSPQVFQNEMYKSLGATLVAAVELFSVLEDIYIYIDYKLMKYSGYKYFMLVDILRVKFSTSKQAQRKSFESVEAELHSDY